ncbi:hypothetical protein GCM10010170_065800 [Dactylosporangium salmoneum]|uniref:Uncharacterized protein n=1 Tax=Dactylosporangium salmoneum TaxID=53361 RepID=A0ABN3H3D2_9ACTN
MHTALPGAGAHGPSGRRCTRPFRAQVHTALPGAGAHGGDVSAAAGVSLLHAEPVRAVRDALSRRLPGVAGVDI